MQLITAATVNGASVWDVMIKTWSVGTKVLTFGGLLVMILDALISRMDWKRIGGLLTALRSKIYWLVFLGFLFGIMMAIASVPYDAIMFKHQMR